MGEPGGWLDRETDFSRLKASVTELQQTLCALPAGSRVLKTPITAVMTCVLTTTGGIDSGC
jgi:hypothetical protein